MNVPTEKQCSLSKAYPIIREVNKNDLNECLEVIHKSFSTVAEQFGLTKDNCPKHTSFIPIYFL